MLISIKVDGMPRGKERPRHLRGGSQHTYTPTKTEKYEDAVRAAGRKAMAGRPPFQHYDRGLSMMITAFVLIPKSWSLDKRNAAFHFRIRPTGKPDHDNIAKVTDALNGVVFGDDAQITDARTLKFYTEGDPCVLIDIWPTPLELPPWRSLP